MSIQLGVGMCSVVSVCEGLLARGGIGSVAEVDGTCMLGEDSCSRVFWKSGSQIWRVSRQ